MSSDEKKPMDRRRAIRYGGGAILIAAATGLGYYAGTQQSSGSGSPTTTTTSTKLPFQPVFLDPGLGQRMNQSLFHNTLDAVNRTESILVKKARSVSNFFTPLNVASELAVVNTHINSVDAALSPLADVLMSPNVDLESVSSLNNAVNKSLSVTFTGVNPNPQGRAFPLIDLYNNQIKLAADNFNQGLPFVDNAKQAAAAVGSLLTTAYDVRREVDRHIDTYDQRVTLNNAFAQIIKEKMGVELDRQLAGDFWDEWHVIGPMIFNEFGYYRRNSARGNKLRGYIGMNAVDIATAAQGNVDAWLRYSQDKKLTGQYKQFSIGQLAELERLNTELEMNAVEKLSFARPGIRRVLEEAAVKSQVHEILRMNLEVGELRPGVIVYTPQDSIFEAEWRTEERKKVDIEQNRSNIMKKFATWPDPSVYTTQVDAFRAFREERRKSMSGKEFRVFNGDNFDYETIAKPEFRNNNVTAWMVDSGHLDAFRLDYSAIEGKPASHGWFAFWSEGRKTYCVRTGIEHAGKWHFFDPGFEEGSPDWGPGYSTVPGTDGEGVLHMPAVYASNFPSLLVENVPKIELYPKYINCGDTCSI